MILLFLSEVYQIYVQTSICADLTFPLLLLMTQQQAKPDRRAAYFYFGRHFSQVREVYPTNPTCTSTSGLSIKKSAISSFI